MRMSVRKNDPGFSREAVRHEVLLDGKLLKRCHTADEDEGLAICLKTDKDGNVIVVNNRIIDVVLYGDVKIRLADGK